MTIPKHGIGCPELKGFSEANEENKAKECVAHE
jgi:hypothetical protein